MSGEIFLHKPPIFLPSDIPTTSATTTASCVNVFSGIDSSWNPLLCLICKLPLKHPIFLQCHHVLCENCLSDQLNKEVGTSTSHVKCLICNYDTLIPDSGILSDSIVKYVLESTSEATDVCANCDSVNQPMFFCETCNQPLCNSCKEQTHQAKMFATHRIVMHEERTGADNVKKCKHHGEPYILFCAENRSLVCINCFRTAKMESRPHYIDLDMAYRTARDKLEKTAKSLKSFQKQIDDCLSLHVTMLEENKRGSENEIKQIEVLCQQMIDKLTEVRDQLVNNLKKESSEREEQLRSQLDKLKHIIPIIQLYLLISSIFCSSTGKMDFLDMGYALNSRIQSFLSSNQCSQPTFPTQVHTNYRADFARALEPFLGMKSVILPSMLHRRLSVPPDTPGNQSPGDVDLLMSPLGFMSNTSTCKSYNGSNSSKSSHRSKHYSKLRLLVDLAGAFGDEYSKIEFELKELNKRFAGISKYAQDVQRDLTVRKCIIDEAKLTKISNVMQKIKIDLGAHSTRVDDLQSTFQQIWEEQLDRVRKQQEVYRIAGERIDGSFLIEVEPYQCRYLQNQVTSMRISMHTLASHCLEAELRQLMLHHDTNHITSIMCLREDLHRMSTASQQLTPFVRSIAHVIGSITPQRCKSEEQCPMQQICSQINTLEPNSQTRVDAIERQEMQRKQELEKKKDEQDSLIVDVKKKLKTSKDRTKRRSNLDLGVIMNSAHSPTNVERERNALADLQIVVSPANSSKQNRLSINVNGDDVFDADTLCESLMQQRTSLCPTPTLFHHRPKSMSSKSNSVSSMASSSVLNLLDTSTDGSEISFENSVILNENRIKIPTPPCVSPVGGATLGSTNKCLPAILLSKVDSATLQARERMLASLKEKITSRAEDL